MAKGNRQVTYDPRCYDLAEIFLEDEPNLNAEEYKKHLAGVIQEAIEGEIEWMRDQHATSSRARAPHNEPETKDAQTDNEED